MAIYASGSNSSITNNTITGNATVTDWAVFIDSATSTISGNAIHGADYGIDVYNTTAKAKISNNNLTGNGIGVQAARALIAKIEGEAPAGNVVDVGFNLVERGTTRQIG